MKKHASISIIGLLWAAPAFAEDSGPHHQRAGAMLDLADQEAKLTFAVLTAKEFDLELSKLLVADLRRAVAEAKSSAFRATALLEPAQSKLEPEFKKLQDAIRKAESGGEKLEADLKEQTKGVKSGDDSGGGIKSADEEEDEDTQPDWDLLKDDLGAMYRDLGEARGLHGKLGKQIKLAALKPPPPPKPKKG